MKGQLWDEYRATWKEFAGRLSELQALVEACDTGRVGAARVQVEEARIAHNAARDRLAAELTVGREDEVLYCSAAGNG